MVQSKEYEDNYLKYIEDGIARIQLKAKAGYVATSDSLNSLKDIEYCTKEMTAVLSVKGKDAEQILYSDIEKQFKVIALKLLPQSELISGLVSLSDDKPKEGDIKK